MRLVEVEDYREMSRLAADMVEREVICRENTVLGLATGSSPLGIYRCLAEDFQKGRISFRGVKGFNLDEYVGLERGDEQSFYAYLKKNLVDPTDFCETNLHVLDGMAENLVEACEKYEKELALAGGIDLQLLGIGGDGHIGFNEPCGYFPRVAHETRLDEKTVQDNARFFVSAEAVPKSAVTMGIGTIMRARKILLVVSGASKAGILCRAVTGRVEPCVPASILQFHMDCTVIGDREAMMELRGKGVKIENAEKI